MDEQKELVPVEAGQHCAYIERTTGYFGEL